MKLFGFELLDELDWIVAEFEGNQVQSLSKPASLNSLPSYSKILNITYVSQKKQTRKLLFNELIVI